MSAIVVFRPERDTVERTLGQWAASFLLAVAGDPSHGATDIRGTAVANRTFRRDVSGNDVVIVFAHGSPSTIGVPTLIDSSDGPALSGRIVAAISCEAGQQLGADLVNTHGASGFLGFDDQLVVNTARPAVYGAVIESMLLALIDPARGGSAARQVGESDFRAVRTQYQAVATDPTKPRRDRMDATLLWLGAHANARTLVWHP